MEKKDEEVLKKIVSEISKLDYVSCVFLFGSQVNGRERSDSDVDITVLTKGASEKEELDVMSYGSDLFDVSAFSRLPLVVQYRVLKEGKMLFCRDKKNLRDIKVKILRLYLDYAVFINNYYLRVIRNV